ncbi:lactoylglutathione lyase [alpha proteobacterium AAP81b]|nr:lactoylglutathione lyase [alpha proteobacterium AAP81b]
MDRMIFINLPVTDLERSIGFYAAMGAVQDHQFSNQVAAKMRFSEAIHVMLLTHEFFSTFTSRAIADAQATAQTLLCLSAESRADVDALVAAAAPAGGSLDPCPVQDRDFMYGRSVADPDGHIWEVMWMDTAAMPADLANAEPVTA